MIMYCDSLNNDVFNLQLINNPVTNKKILITDILMQWKIEWFEPKGTNKMFRLQKLSKTC